MNIDSDIEPYLRLCNKKPKLISTTRSVDASEAADQSQIDKISELEKSNATVPPPTRSEYAGIFKRRSPYTRCLDYIHEYEIDYQFCDSGTIKNPYMCEKLSHLSFSDLWITRKIETYAKATTALYNKIFHEDGKGGLQFVKLVRAAQTGFVSYYITFTAKDLNCGSQGTYQAIIWRAPCRPGCKVIAFRRDPSDDMRGTHTYLANWYWDNRGCESECPLVAIEFGWI